MQHIGLLAVILHLCDPRAPTSFHCKPLPHDVMANHSEHTSIHRPACMQSTGSRIFGCNARRADADDQPDAGLQHAVLVQMALTGSHLAAATSAVTASFRRAELLKL